MRRSIELPVVLGSTTYFEMCAQKVTEHRFKLSGRCSGLLIHRYQRFMARYRRLSYLEFINIGIELEAIERDCIRGNAAPAVVGTIRMVELWDGGRKFARMCKLIINISCTQ